MSQATLQPVVSPCAPTRRTEIRARLHPSTRGCLDLVVEGRNVGHLCAGTVGEQVVSATDSTLEDRDLPVGTRIVVGNEVAVLPASRAKPIPTSGPLQDDPAYRAHYPAPPGPEPTAYAMFQWKGTWAVLAFTCACGAVVEAEGEFLYHLECPFCRAYYHIHDRVTLSVLEEGADPKGSP